MDFLFILYNEVLYRPLFNALVWFYTVVPYQDIGVAIILLTLVTRAVMTPLYLKSQKAQRELAIIQPEIKKIQEQHKNDKEQQGRALMELYAKHKVNPFSGCVVMLVQFPVLITLFFLFQKGFDPEQLNLLYGFIPNPETIDPLSLGFFDLSQSSMVLGVLAAVTQYFQMKLAMPPLSPLAPGQKMDFARIFQMQALYVFPLVILLLARTFPAAVILYWTVANIFGIVQEIIVKKYRKQGV